MSFAFQYILTYSNNTEMIYENSKNKWTLCNDWLFLFTAGRCILFLSDGWDHGTDDSDDLFGFGGCRRDKRFYARCYRLLELDNDSSQDLVRSQYIKLAKIHHPDSGQAASVKRFHRIDQAYRELTKKFAEEKRKEEECVGEYGLYYDPADHETQ